MNLANLWSRFLSGLRRFFDWWRGELLALVPDRLRERLSRPFQHTIIDIGDERIELRIVDGASSREGAFVPRTREDIDSLRGSIGTLVDAGKIAGEVIVRLPVKNALLKRLEFPLEIEPTLRDALALQMERHTPLDPAEIYFDYRVIEKSTAAGRLNIELAVMEKEVVDGISQAVRESGLTLNALGLLNDPASLETSYNFLPRQKEGSTLDWRKPEFALSALAVCLVIIASLVVSGQRREEILFLEGLLAEAQESAMTTSRLQGEVDRIAERSNLLAHKKSAPAVVAMLDALTQVVPDTVYFRELDMDEQTVRASGHAAEAAVLIPLIDASPMFEGAQFSSPIVQAPRESGERFELSFEISLGPLERGPVK